MKYLAYSKELTLFFEKLRLLRNFSQESFTEGIISLRQYRRYLSGEYHMPQSVINSLSNRLGIRPEHLILEFESSKRQETNLMNAFHNAIVNKDFEKAEQLEKDIHLGSLIDINNLSIYKYSLLLRKFYLNQLTELSFIKEIKELIQYDQLLKKTAFSSTEIIILSSLLSLDKFNEKNKIIMLLKGFLTTTGNLLSGQNEKTILLCYYRIADYAGLSGDFNEVISVCDDALNYGRKIKSNYLLPDFFYYKSLAYHFLNDKNETNDSLLKLFYSLELEDNDKKAAYYSSLLEKYFNQSLDLLITKIKNE